MKSVINRIGTSFHRDYLILAIILVVTAVALVAGSVASAHKANLASAPQEKRAAATEAAKKQQGTDKKAAKGRASDPWRDQMLEDDDEDDGMAKTGGARQRSEEIFGPFDYDLFLEREKSGQFPYQGGQLPSDAPFDALTNNNSGSTGTALFTQSETSVVAFGNTVVVAYNDSGSNAGGTNKFTGFSRSTDGGNTFTDGGSLPTNAGGDAGDPVLARNETTGRIYFTTLGFSAQCVPTSCTSSADCAPGFNCASYVGNCSPSGYACQLPSDECVSNADCTHGECFYTDTGRTCLNPNLCLLDRYEPSSAPDAGQ